MATILILSFTDLKLDPRVRRQIQALQTEYSVIAAGTGDPELPGVSFVGCRRRSHGLARKLTDKCALILRRYESYYWRSDHVRDLQTQLASLSFDLVIANDVETLPLALKLAGRRPVIIDAHEYAPREMEESLRWRVFHQGHVRYVCDTYLRKAAKVITVAEGIAQEYHNDYGVKPVVVTNAANGQNFTIKPTVDRRIRMIHHGHAMPTRQIEKMIELVGRLDERFELDLLLVPTFPSYLERLKHLAARDPRVRFLSPVSPDTLVAVSNDYDLGLYLLAPSSFNNLHALPNKFFEFLQARLAIAIGPSPEMARIVREFQCGVVGDDFSPASLARALNRLSSSEIDRMKAGSDRAARIFTGEKNAEALRQLVGGILKETSW